MDWNTILFATRWVMIALFYFVLLVLLYGVYREAASRVSAKNTEEIFTYGRLRLIQPGSDPNAIPGKIINLKTVTTFGVQPDNDIVLGDQFVSGHHFSLHWEGDGWWIRDLNSKNGTLVNQQSVQPGQPQSISSGSMITAGDMVLELIE